MSIQTRPGIGIGVYVVKDGKILIGKRNDVGAYCAPGGHLEMGESWEGCARREVQEEVGIEIETVRFGSATNDIFPDGKHYVTIQMIADWKSGEPRVMEPDKFEGEWAWYGINEIPEPRFLSLNNFLNNPYNPFKTV